MATDDQTGHGIDRQRARLPEPFDAQPVGQDAWSTPESSQGKQLSFNLKAVAWLTAGAFLVGGITYLNMPGETPPPETVDLSGENAPFLTEKYQAGVNKKRSNVKIACDDKFLVGAFAVTDDLEESHTLTLRNKHRYNIMVMLYEEKTGQRVQMVGVESESSESVAMAPGRYRMEVQSGNEWCNTDIGFKDGVRADMKGAILVGQHESVAMEFISTGTEPGDFNPRLIEGKKNPKPGAKSKQASGKDDKPDAADPEAPPANSKQSRNKSLKNESRSAAAECKSTEPPTEPVEYEISGPNYLQLKPFSGGSYYVTGSANNFPVVFTVDPGAPTVVLPQHIAARAGIRSCVQKTIQTHVGGIRGCFALLPDMVFGEFRVRNAEVMVLQAPSGDAVIGMSLLKRFRVEQVGGVIQITKASAMNH